MGCFTSLLQLMFLPFILVFYAWKTIILVFWEIFKFIISSLSGLAMNSSYHYYSKSYNSNKKANKNTNYRDMKFDKEADLWGLSESDRRIAKQERMSSADFVEAEERDDDELVTDEWEDK